ncbi:MAG: 16S rRNA (adenine(1518)-N(6)/adenine(1519)-N(6))-dimethyltransferase RsmA [Clostridiales bacterium]|nr:16S rRNA (adenine(1518)-N(6)/adenine(1519)-N(6))-dimethyltransferase RsmA [Clostridiales bacterium]
MDLCNPKEIKALLGRHGFRFSKQMGQNFLIQSWVPRQTAEASGAGPGVGVLEIGPGIGPLTEQLAALGAKVVSVELDRTLLPILAETLAGRDNVEIVPGDILKLDLPALCREKFPGMPVVACANLPYNITTPILTALLQSGCFQQVTVMIQREVAQRICAQPGTAAYGAFTLLCQYYADREILYDVPPSCFLPAPKVVSSVLRMTVRGQPPVPVADEAFFFRLVRAAFGQRRKTLVNVLYPLLEKRVDKQTLAAQLVSCNLTEDIRGERLTFAEFAQLTEKLTNLACIKTCKEI